MIFWVNYHLTWDYFGFNRTFWDGLGSYGIFQDALGFIKHQLASNTELI